MKNICPRSQKLFTVLFTFMISLSSLMALWSVFQEGVSAVAAGSEGDLSIDNSPLYESETKEKTTGAVRSAPFFLQNATSVYSNTFEGGVGSEWSQTTTETLDGHTFLGRFGSQQVDLSLLNLPSHGAVTITMQLYVFGLWDGIQFIDNEGPDRWLLRVMNGPALLDTTFSVWTDPFDMDWWQNYPESFPDGGPYPGRSGADELWDEENGATYNLTYSFSHSDADLILNFIAQQVGNADEYWGIDNIEITVGNSLGTAPATARQDAAIALGPDDIVYGVWQASNNDTGSTEIYFGYGYDWLYGTEIVNDIATEVYHPDIAVDANGNAYAVWIDGRDSFCSGVVCYYDIYFAYRPMYGEWSQHERINDVSHPVIAYPSLGEGWDWQVIGPAISVNANGDAYVIWADDRTGAGSSDRQIYFDTRPAWGGWGTDELVNDITNEFDRAYPDIAVDAEGNAHAVWIDGRNGSGLGVYAAYRPVGGAWQANTALADPLNASMSSPQIAVDAGGNAYASWVNATNGYTIQINTRPNEGSWGSESEIYSTSSGYVEALAMGLNSAGDAFITWSEERFSNRDIYLMPRYADESWGTEILLSDNILPPQIDPAVAVGSNGRAYLAWTDKSDPLLNNVVETTFSLDGAVASLAHLVADPTMVIANGIDTAVVTATIHNAYDEPIVGKEVIIYGSNGTSFEVEQPTVTTDANGQVQAFIRATEAQTMMVAAFVPADVVTIDETVILAFVPGQVDPNVSSLTVFGSQSAMADGIDTVEVIITARDVNDNPVPGVPTSLATDPTVTITPLNDVTDNHGRAIYRLSHNQPAAVTVTATANGVLLNDTLSVTFVGADLALSKSGPAAVPAGLPIEYTLTIANEGLLTATNVVVTDTLPTSVFVEDIISSFFSSTYYADTHTLVLQADELPAAAVEVVTLVGGVWPTETFNVTISNTIQGSIAAVELDLNNNQASHVTTILEPAPTLVVTPITPTLSVLRGSTESLLITVSNNGTETAYNVQVMPPPYISWVNAHPLTLTELGIGQTFTFTLQATAPFSQPIGFYHDDVWVTSSNYASTAVRLTVYVHPPLTNLTTLVTNDVGEAVTNALVTFRRDEQWVRYLYGELIDEIDIRYQRYTRSNGQALISGMETGVYSYDITAPSHLPVSGVLTVTETTTQFIAPPLPALPTLVFEPDQATMSARPGDVADFMLTVRNTGPGTATNFAVDTPDDLPWLSVALPYSVTTLAADEAMSVRLFLSPPDDNQEITYQRYITVTAAEVEPAILAAAIQVVTTDIGYLSFTVLDDFAAPLQNAKVYVLDQDGRTVVHPDGSEETVYESYDGTTDANGRVLLPEVPPGEYRYVVRAESFYTYEGLVTVSPGYPPAENETGTAVLPSLLADDIGGVNDVDISLEYDPFYYTWSVEETQITDTYAYSVEIVYTSDIARPALFISQEFICPSANEQHWLLVNMGPITLTNIALTPHFPFFNFTFDNGTNIVDELIPGEAITVPFHVSSPVPLNQNSVIGVIKADSEYLLTNGQTKIYSTHNTMTRCGEGEGGNGGGNGGGGGWNWVWYPQDEIVTGEFTTRSIPRFPSSTPPAVPTEDFGEVALFYLIGDATLERQAFDARLALASNGADTIEDIHVLVDIRDAEGQLPPNFYFVPTQTASLGTLTPGDADGVEGEWKIIPGDLGITNTEGVTFAVRAIIHYRLNGQANVITTTPSIITVLPQPQLYLNFAHSQPDIHGDFVITVSVQNNGYGIARNFKMDLSGMFMDEVRAYEDVDQNGRKLIFTLKETQINNEIVEVPEYTFPFGDIQPDEQMTGTWHIAVDADDGEHLLNPTIYRFSVRCRHLPFGGVDISPLLNCGQHRDVLLIDDHEFFCMVERYRVLGGPINTANGNYAYIQEMPALPTAGEPLAFAWTYNSLNSGAFPDLPAKGSALGNGWSYAYDISLDTADPEQIVLHTPRGTSLTFIWIKNRYETHPMACATLTRNENDGSFTLTSDQQSVYHFDATGQLQSQDDAQGNTVFYMYNADGRVSQVTEPDSAQQLHFVYDEDERLATVSDTISRAVQFGYDTLGYLATVTDTRGLPWQYEYSQLPGGQYVLSHIIDPDGRTVEQTAFDAIGRAISQTYGSRSLTIDYTRNHRFVSDGRGLQTVLVYNEQGLLVASNDSQNHLERYVFDLNYNRVWQQNNNGVPMRFSQTPEGYKTRVANAYGHTFQFAYDPRNNMTYQRDARGLETFISYNAQNNPITRTNHLGDSTAYTYNDAGQVSSMTDENGHTTTYEYNEFGWQTAISDPLGNTTYTAYDQVGRPITITDALGNVTLYAYDGADQVVQIIENARPGQPQNYLNTYNLITQYQYDGAGNQIAKIDTFGRVSRTFYDETGQVSARIVNWSGTILNPADCLFPPTLPDQDLCTRYTYDEEGQKLTETDPLGRSTRTFYDALNRVSAQIVNWSGTILDPADCLFPPALPDQDLCTLYVYDPVGNRILQTDPLGRQTRTFFNSINQPVAVIENWSGTITDMTQVADCLALPPDRDSDVCTLTTYNELGQIEIVTDALGRSTRTFYDELNRVSAVVEHWTPTLTSPAQCDLSPINTSEENVCTVYGYDAAGNQTTVTNALGQTSLTVYDERNQPLLTVNNWDGSPITAVSDCTFPPAQADVNVCTATTYDPLHRPLSSLDALGNLTTYAYDAAGRLITTTQSLDGVPVQSITRYDAAGNRIGYIDPLGHETTMAYDQLNRVITTTTAAGVISTLTFDAVGQVLSSRNGLGQTTYFTYDALNRLLTTTDALGNITGHEYDALHQTAVVDAAGTRMSYQYDGLDRMVGVVENDTGGLPTVDSNILTQYTFDVMGNQLSIINGHGYTSTSTTYDAHNRPLISIDALGNQTLYNYDALGNLRTYTDGNGEVMSNQYDGLNRLITTTYVTDGQVVGYGYDAAGNTLVMSDSVGVTQYAYDDLHRLIQVTHPVTGVVAYDYDLAGNRTELTYPDGRQVSYTYDADSRLTQVIDWNGTATTYTYDAAGRQTVTTLPNEVVANSSYDAAGRLIRLTYTDGVTGEIQADYAYTLNGLGNRVVATETVALPGEAGSDGPWLVNLPMTVTNLAQNQQEAAVAYNSSANEYLVVFRDRRFDDGNIYAMRTDTQGAPLGAAILVSGNSSGLQRFPVVAYNPDADVYLVVWENTQGTNITINGRLLAGNGQPQGSDLIIAQAIFTSYYQPDVVYDAASRGFVVVWSRVYLLAQSIQAQFVAVDGTPGALLDLSATYPSSTMPALATDGQGKFLVVWRTHQSLQAPDIVGRLFNNAGPIGLPLMITNADNTQEFPDVAYDSHSNRYLAVWDDQRSGGQAVYGQLIESNGSIRGSNFSLSKGAPDEQPAVTAVDSQFLVATEANEDLYLITVNADGTVPERITLRAAPGIQALPALAAADTTALAAWNSNEASLGGRLNYDIYAASISREPGQGGAGGTQTVVIHYTYDPLQRLTETVYSGDLNAAYQYQYDAVGNMVVYTDTVETLTQVVNRSFDAANQLLIATGDDGSSSYLYDNVGNLIMMIPPGDEQAQLYAYDQRHLLLHSTQYISGTGYLPLADYTYDGNGNRLFQVDYSGGAPITTTYTNDAMGLSQVLLARSGITQTHMLFGRDFIAQDNGSEARVLLADGLGSVRVEMVDTAVAAALTYEPFGQVIFQSDDRGTVYGFTGEETDIATGLVYLRARYYSPGLRLFLSRDPFPGYASRPQSQNGYSYVENNPVNLTDPTGESPDTLLDIVFIAHDIQVLFFDLRTKCGNIMADILSLIADGIGALIPFISGAGHIDDAAQATRIIDKVDNVDEALEAATKLDKIDDNGRILVQVAGGSEEIRLLTTGLDSIDDLAPIAIKAGDNTDNLIVGTAYVENGRPVFQLDDPVQAFDSEGKPLALYTGGESAWKEAQEGFAILANTPAGKAAGKLVDNFKAANPHLSAQEITAFEEAVWQEISVQLARYLGETTNQIHVFARRTVKNGDLLVVDPDRIFMQFELRALNDYPEIELIFHVVE